MSVQLILVPGIPLLSLIRITSLLDLAMLVQGAQVVGCTDYWRGVGVGRFFCRNKVR